MTVQGGGEGGFDCNYTQGNLEGDGRFKRLDRQKLLNCTFKMGTFYSVLVQLPKKVCLSMTKPCNSWMPSSGLPCGLVAAVRGREPGLRVWPHGSQGSWDGEWPEPPQRMGSSLKGTAAGLGVGDGTGSWEWGQHTAQRQLTHHPVVARGCGGTVTAGRGRWRCGQ